MIGIDEVGRGCWAGPLLVVAAMEVSPLPLVQDSKMLSKSERQELIPLLRLSCVFGQGWVQASEIDTLGLTGAMKLGVQRALIDLNQPLDSQVIMDGHINYCPETYMNVKCVVKADSIHPIVSAASIIAKVQRDAYMIQLSKQYPLFGFENHVGYGTKQHIAALKELGITPEHRKSYKPIRALL